MRVSFWDGFKWVLLFESPWPQIFVTGSARNSVVEPNSLINGAANSENGAPWGFVNKVGLGLIRRVTPLLGMFAPIRFLMFSTVMGPLDVHYMIDEHLAKIMSKIFWLT